MKTKNFILFVAVPVFGQLALYCKGFFGTMAKQHMNRG
jgi:hypothetical protein